MADYVICAREIKAGSFTDEPGPISYLKVAGNAKSYNAKNIVDDRAAWITEIQGLADGDENPNSISPTGDVLVLVHGYNNDIVSVLTRMRQLRKNLKAEGWHGEVIAFDWPSNNQVLNYLEDRADGAQVAAELVLSGLVLLNEAQKQGCKTNVHLIGHSTGAYVIMEAFAQAEKKGSLFKSDWRVGQVAFVSGDVSQASLSASSDWNAPLFRRIMRLTNYSNPYDSVLAVSNAKRLGVSPRAGRVGLPGDANPKAVNVDCGDYFRDLDPASQSGTVGSWSHSWYLNNRVFARDLAMTMEGAIDRHAIPTRFERSGKLFLQDKPRPKFMAAWDIKADAKNAAPRTV
jgi:pimeloyl-ACP methyl ester carboxylesterase